MSRDILKRLEQATLVALRCKGGAWVGSFFTRPPIPEAWLGLVVRPDGTRRLAPPGEDPRPDDDDTLVLVRHLAIAVPLELRDAPTAGEHCVDATVEILLRCPAREDDLAALHQTLLGEPELTIQRLTLAFDRAGALAALRSFARGQPAEKLVREDMRDALLTHLRSELRRFLFSAGLELPRLGRVEFTSAGLAAQQALERETARRMGELEARGAVERAALAATHRRLDDLGSVLTKLKTAAAEDGSLQWHQLLPTLTPGERGRLLESLWRLTPDRACAAALLIVAGYDAVWLDPADLTRFTQRVALPPDLGGLRSANFDADSGDLLIGAARGVWRIDAATGEVRAKYAVPGDETPRTGFNAAVTRGGQLFATHSQLGAWSWLLHDPADARALLRPIEGMPRTIRAVTVDRRGRVLLAADNRVHAFDLAGETAWQTGPADGSIHCLATLEDWVFAGTSTGALLRCDLDLRDAWLPVHRARGAIESISARRWDDLVELVIPAGADGICGVYVGEGLVSRLLTAAQPIRRAWACDDLLVGLTETRDRLVVLSSAAAGREGVDVPIGRMLGAAVQDACVVTRHDGKGASAAGEHEGETT